MRADGLDRLKEHRFRIRLGSFLISMVLSLGLYAAARADFSGLTWILIGIMAFNQLILLFL